MKASRFDNPFLAWAMTMEDYKDSVANDGLPARAPHPPATPHVDIAEIHNVHIGAMHVVAESKQVLGQVLLAPPEQAAAAHRASCISRLRLMWWYAGQTTHVRCQLVAFHTLPCVPSQHPTKGTLLPKGYNLLHLWRRTQLLAPGLDPDPQCSSTALLQPRSVHEPGWKPCPDFTPPPPVLTVDELRHAKLVPTWPCHEPQSAHPYRGS